MTIVCYDDQQDAVTSFNAGFRTHTLPRGAHYSQVAENVWDLIYDQKNIFSKEDQLFVLSYHAEVLKLQARLEPHFKPQVNFVYWATVTSKGTVVTRPVSPKPSWPEALLPRDEAVSILIKTLQKNGAVDRPTAIRQADLRFYLSRVDYRLSKSTQLGSLPGLIKLLVEAAASKGAIQIDRESDTVNPFVWIGQPAKEDVTKSSNTQKASNINKGEKSISQEYMDTLRSKGLGPFSSIREVLYDCMEVVVKNATKKRSRPMPVGSVLTATIDQTIAICNEGINAGKLAVDKFPWRRVRDFLINIMTRRPVLIDENKQVVAPTFSSLTTVVTGLKENWREDLDGELIVALVESGTGLHLADTPSLSGALFVSRDEKDEQRIWELINYLLKKRRLIEQGSPYYSLAIPESLIEKEVTQPVQELDPDFASNQEAFTAPVETGETSTTS